MNNKKAGTNELWEPGSRWTLQDVYVKNNGNLDMLYKITVTGIKGDAKLNEVFTWTIKLGEEEVVLENGISQEFFLAGGSGTVVLTEDIALNEIVTVDGNYTLDLGGNTLDVDVQNGLTVAPNANLTITNGTGEAIDIGDTIVNCNNPITVNVFKSTWDGNCVSEDDVINNEVATGKIVVNEK